MALGSSAGVSGCHVWNRLWGKDTVDLTKADIKSMSVDIRKERKTSGLGREYGLLGLQGYTEPKVLSNWKSPMA